MGPHFVSNPRAACWNPRRAELLSVCYGVDSTVRAVYLERMRLIVGTMTIVRGSTWKLVAQTFPTPCRLNHKTFLGSEHCLYDAELPRGGLKFTFLKCFERSPVRWAVITLFLHCYSNSFSTASTCNFVHATLWTTVYSAAYYFYRQMSQLFRVLIGAPALVLPVVYGVG